MHEEKVKIEQLAQDPNFSISGGPGNLRLKWQDASARRHKRTTQGALAPGRLSGGF